MKLCLIVDDSSSIQKVARCILEGWNVEALEATSSEEALRTCQAQMPDCVVVDWNMPDLDGLRFIANLRRLPGGDKAAVVCCVPENDPVELAKAMQSGARGCVLKPFDRESMARSFASIGVI